MQKRTDLIVFGQDFKRYPSVIEHVITKLLPRHRVIWVETIGMRNPTLSVYDFKRVVEKITGWLFSRKHKLEIPNGLSIVNPILLPYSQFAVVRAFNRFMTNRAVKQEIVKRVFLNFKLITTVPSSEGSVGILGENESLYYCIDEWSLWPGLDPLVMNQLEKKLLAKVDKVVVSSDELLKTKKIAKTPITKITHGVDFDHFNQAYKTHKSGTKHLMAYFGLFDERSDQKLLVKLAAANRDSTIQIIGKCVVNCDLLKQEPNIEFLGEVNYADLPAKIKNIDLFLLPYFSDSLGDNINPIKIKEYLATGKPVVATALKEVQKLSDYLSVCSDHQEFLAAVKEVKNRGNSHDTAKTFKFLHAESWQQKAAQLAHFLGLETAYSAQ